MRICRFSISVLLLLAFLAPALIASGFENSGIGIKARAMSGAFRAIADDWTAAYYNPAGYAFVYDNQLGANAAFVHYRDELTPNYVWPGGSGWEQQGVYNNHTIYNFHEILSNPSAGFIVRLPVLGESVFGLSGYQPFDYNLSWELYSHEDAYNNVLSMGGDQFRNNLDVVAFQLTAAREQIEDKLSIGVGLQILRADLVFHDVIFRDNPFWDNFPYQYQTEFTRKITQLNHNDGSGYGFGIRTGAFWKLNEKTNVAFTFNLPFDVTVTGRSLLEFDMPLVQLAKPDTAQLANPGQPGNLFISGSRVVDSADFEASLDLPPSFGFGIASKVNEKLTVAFDIEYTFWSDYEGLTFQFSNHQGLPQAADTSEIARSFIVSDLSNPVEWKDAGKVMVGVMYNYSDLLTLLGGLSYDQSPSKESEQITPQFIDTGDKLGFTGGLIFSIEQWELGIATSYVKASELTVTSLEDLDGDSNMDSFAGAYKADTYETILSFNYRF